MGKDYFSKHKYSKYSRSRSRSISLSKSRKRDSYSPRKKRDDDRQKSNDKYNYYKNKNYKNEDRYPVKERYPDYRDTRDKEKTKRDYSIDKRDKKYSPSNKYRDIVRDRDRYNYKDGFEKSSYTRDNTESKSI